MVLRLQSGWDAVRHTGEQRKESNMGDDFRESVFYEVGEAIGNVGRKLLRRRRKQVDKEVLQHWMERVPLPTLQRPEGERDGGKIEVIDASYRVIRDQEEDENDRGTR
jgi:hypothetical protein